jgi:hypothetical protein
MFVWLSEKKTATISLCCINILSFIAQRKYVYCAVQTKSLYIIQFGFSLERPILLNSILA